MLIQEDNILLVTSTDVPLTYCWWHFVAMGSYRTLRLNMHDSDFPNSSSSLVSAKFFYEVKVKCELNSTWKTNRNLSCVTAWYLGYVFGFGINILLILLFIFRETIASKIPWSFLTRRECHWIYHLNNGVLDFFACTPGIQRLAGIELLRLVKKLFFSAWPFECLF